MQILPLSYFQVGSTLKLSLKRLFRFILAFENSSWADSIDQIGYVKCYKTEKGSYLSWMVSGLISSKAWISRPTMHL